MPFLGSSKRSIRYHAVRCCGMHIPHDAWFYRSGLWLQQRYSFALRGLEAGPRRHVEEQYVNVLALKKRWSMFGEWKIHRQRAGQGLPYRPAQAASAFQEVLKSLLTHRRCSTRSSTPNSMNQTQYAPAATAGGQQNGPVSFNKRSQSLHKDNIELALICNRYHNR